MREGLTTLDRILRGHLTSREALAAESLSIPVRPLSVLLILLAASYGGCMGTFALLRPEGPVVMQLVANLFKMPMLFILTFVVTFPSLYVFGALFDARLTLVRVGQIVLAASVVLISVLASFGPITAFFSLSTKSYEFVVLMNVFFCSMAGAIGWQFLVWTMLVQESIPRSEPEGSEVPASLPSTEPTSTLERWWSTIRVPPPNVFLFVLWSLLFACVGAQMGWILRPFIGHPDVPFTWFRDRESNFFEAFAALLESILSSLFQ